MTEQNAHDDERDTADLAANDAADLAAGDATRAQAAVEAWNHPSHDGAFGRIVRPDDRRRRRLCVRDSRRGVRQAQRGGHPAGIGFVA